MAQELLYRETFEQGPGVWCTGKNREDGSWHRNVFGFRGHPVPLSWNPDGGQTGGCAYAEPPWYFDDNHGEFAWLYLLCFVNRSIELGLSTPDLRNATIQLTLRGNNFDLKGSTLYFWIQGYDSVAAENDNQPNTDKPLYNWALTSSPVSGGLLDGQWHDETITLFSDESKWSAMGLLNGGLARAIQVVQSRSSAAGTLNGILSGGHVNLGFLLCGIDPNDTPTGRIEIDQISIFAAPA